MLCTKRWLSGLVRTRGRCCLHSGGHEEQIQEMKAELSAYTGGAVDLVKHDTGIAELVLNYPESCNALTGRMVVDLDLAVEDLYSWDTGKALLIRGASNRKNFFCSGGHLEGLVKKVDTGEKGYRLSVIMNSIARRIRQLPLISAAVVDGPALGGGAELLTVPDHRLATSRAIVAFVQAKMGVSTGFGGGPGLVDLVGYNRALDLIITGRKLGLEEGLRIGFFDAELETGDRDARDQAISWLQERTDAYSPQVIRNIKAILNLRPDQRELESVYFAKLWRGADHNRALENNTKHK